MARSFFSAIDNLSLQDIESEADLIPLLTTEDEEALENEALPEVVPILPLRNTVLFWQETIIVDNNIIRIFFILINLWFVSFQDKKFYNIYTPELNEEDVPMI